MQDSPAWKRKLPYKISKSLKIKIKTGQIKQLFEKRLEYLKKRKDQDAS